MLLLIPQLNGIDNVLPHHVGTRSYDGHRIKEMEHEPDAYHIILLTEALASADAGFLTPDAANRLAEGEKDKAHNKRKEKQEKEHHA